MNTSPPPSAPPSARPSPTPTSNNDAAAAVATALEEDAHPALDKDSHLPLEERFARVAALTKQHLASDETARRARAALSAQNKALLQQVAALSQENATLRARGGAADADNDTTVGLRRELAQARFRLMTCGKLKGVLARAGVAVDPYTKKAGLVELCMREIR